MSPVDFTKYQPPGVYVSESVGSVINGGFGQEVSVALVGEALGYLSATDQIHDPDETNSDVGMVGIVAYPFSHGAIVSGSVKAIGIETGAGFTADTDFVVTMGVGDEANTTVARKLTEVTSEVVTLMGELPSKLAHALYVEVGAVVKDATDLVTYVEVDDYVIDYNNGTIRRTPDSTIVTGAEVHVTYSYCAIKSGNHVAFTYDYVSAGYTGVYGFSDYEDVTRFYGEPLDSLGAIQSPLSFAAYFAFRNGAESIFCVAVASAATITDWEDAIAKLESLTELDIIVPVTGDPNVHALVLSHVSAMSANGAERRAILGRDGTVTPVASSVLQSEALSMTNSRMHIASPSTVGYFNPSLNTIDTIGAQYWAAAALGTAASQPPFMPLTMKPQFGFAKMTEFRSKAQKTAESRAGLMVFEDNAGGGIRIRHGISTDVSSVLTREWSVMFAKDKLVKELRETYDSIIGQPISESTPFIVKALTIGALSRMKSSGYINDFVDAKIRQNSTDPTLIEVKFEYKPTFPLNYVYVQFSIDMSSGSIELA